LTLVIHTGDAAKRHKSSHGEALFEATVGKPYLLLKSEGHTTGLGGITPDMIKDLRELAQTMQSDGDVEMHRVFREVRADPAEIDRSVETFCNAQA
jgi:uncharacterized protein YycO